MMIWRTNLIAAAVIGGLMVVPTARAADDIDFGADSALQARIDGGDLLSLPLPPPRPLSATPTQRKPRKVTVVRLDGAAERRPVAAAAEPAKPLRFWMSVGTGF
jgi:hypothetical protein